MTRWSPIGATSSKSNCGPGTACTSTLLFAGISFDKARAVFGAFTKNGGVPG
jgi:hypothetical protein